MASYPPPPPNKDWRAQRRILREQARLQTLQLRGMRRSSIVGPLLVIAIGVLFLLVQIGRLPGLLIWTSFARWWPLLLVLFGTVRLVEWLLDQRSSGSSAGAYPPRSLGFGVSLLLGLLVLAGVASSLLHSKAEHLIGRNFEINEDNLDEFFGQKHESTESLTEACPPGTTVTVVNPHGNVTIAGTSDDDRLHLTVNSQVFTRSDSDAANKTRQIAARIAHVGNSLSLSIPPIEGGRADLVITVPVTAVVTGTVNHGDVEVHTLKAPVTLTANHGDIDVSAITGTVTAHINNADSSFSAHSVTGEVVVEGRSLDLTLSDIAGTISLNGDFFGTTHLERIANAVRFHTSRTDMQIARLDGELEITQSADLTADRLVGPLVLNTRNRNITLDRVSGPLSITNRNGSVTVSVAQPIGSMMIENRNGSVDVTLPTDAEFSVQAETANADLENDFGLPLTSEGEHPKLVGSVGKGGPNLQITTSQADLSLHKGSIAPLPPSPPTPPKLTDAPADAKQTLRERKR